MAQLVARYLGVTMTARSIVDHCAHPKVPTIDIGTNNSGHLEIMTHFGIPADLIFYAIIIPGFSFDILIDSLISLISSASFFSHSSSVDAYTFWEKAVKIFSIPKKKTERF